MILTWNFLKRHGLWTRDRVYHMDLQKLQICLKLKEVELVLYTKWASILESFSPVTLFKLFDGRQTCVFWHTTLQSLVMDMVVATIVNGLLEVFLEWFPKISLNFFINSQPSHYTQFFLVAVMIWEMGRNILNLLAYI